MNANLVAATNHAWNQAILAASAYCHTLPIFSPEDPGGMEAYVRANAPLLQSVLQSVDFHESKPLFKPTFDDASGAISWDAVGCLNARYHQTDISVRESPTAEVWTPIMSVIAVWSGVSIDIFSCVPAKIDAELDLIREKVRAAKAKA